MNILVTGACGFIGSHTVERLVKKGYNVKAFTFYNSKGSKGWIDNLDKKIIREINIISGDIRDQDFLINNSKKTDAILHLAALIGIPYSYHAPKSYLETNVIGTYNILNASKINNISKTIITSTSEVYGTAQSIPISENHSLNAQSPYAASKTGADQLALSFHRSYKLPVTIIRPFNTFGPRQSARAIIPTIITQILNNNGNIKLGNLSPTRDFTFVEDTADSFIQSLKSNKIVGETINIGNNFEISIKDIIKIMKEDFGYKFKVSLDKKRVREKKSEVFRLITSNTKAKKLLNWKPKYAGVKGFKLGLKKTIEWFQDPKNLKDYNSQSYEI
ncbi:SDR family NAD(P)-dependent oxidoreductase [Pelagibacteraceae bacterium]|jgi:NAD dependent epimerase/dehydratase|nr:SDR family NAD(P)-dependent oxidoreductase [Pelagibacteraceae bacterium]